MMGSDMGQQQQQVVYDSTGGGGYAQQQPQPQQQYMGMQQYGGYPQQVATAQQPQQQYGGMVQQTTGYGMTHGMYIVWVVYVERSSCKHRGYIGLSPGNFC